MAHHRVVSIRLIRNLESESKLFHCGDCGYPIFEYQGDLVSEVPGDSTTQLPVSIRCKSRNLIRNGQRVKCEREYRIKGMVEPVMA